jgi:hypothetical protein
VGSSLPYLSASNVPITFPSFIIHIIRPGDVLLPGALHLLLCRGAIGIGAKSCCDTLMVMVIVLALQLALGREMHLCIMDVVMGTRMCLGRVWCAYLGIQDSGDTNGGCAAAMPSTAQPKAV